MTQRTTTIITPEQSVASIVTSHSECAALFLQLRIDFCWKGEQSLLVASAARLLPVSDVIDELMCVIDEGDGQVGGGVAPARLTTGALVAHIVEKHHAYLRKTLPLVVSLAAKVARVHGAHNPRLLAVSELAAGLAAQLLPHLEYEETVLFLALLAPDRDKALLDVGLARMQAEHLAVGVSLGRVRDETEEYSLPDWACASYKTLILELKQLELDLLKHIHLENYVLAPRFA